MLPFLGNDVVNKKPTKQPRDYLVFFENFNYHLPVMNAGLFDQVKMQLIIECFMTQDTSYQVGG